MFLIIFFLCSFGLSVFLTPWIRWFSISKDIVDRPNQKRKIHKTPIALLGGFAIYLSSLFVTFLALTSTSILTSGTIQMSHYIGYFLAGLILVIVGYFDDRFELKPWQSFLGPLFAILIVIFFGFEIHKLTNPFGGYFYLSSFVSSILVFSWLFLMAYTTKLLDGLDGLSTSVSSVGIFMIFLLSMSEKYFQPDVSLFSIILFGASLGFFVWNRYPARIFLGEGGSTLLGFSLGILSIISGGKLAIALLVFAIPLFDLLFVILKRIRRNGITSVFQSDQEHFHHLLLKRDWNQKKIVWFYVGISLFTALIGLFLQSREKFILLFAVFVLFLFLLILLKNKQNLGLTLKKK